MRLSGLFLSVTLLFCIQFGSVLSQQDIIGTWTNPNAAPRANQAKDFCCIPESITIEKDGSGYSANYEYDGILSSKTNSQCVTLFAGKLNTKLSLAKNPRDDASFTATASFFTIPLEVFTYNIVGTQLYISYSKNYSPNKDLPASYYQCNFAMQTYKSPSFTGKLSLIIVILMSIGYCLWNKYRNKQMNLIAQQKAQHQPQPYPAIPNTGYVAPNMSYPQQQPMGMPQANVQFQAQGYPQNPMGMAMPQTQVTINIITGAPPL